MGPPAVPEISDVAAAVVAIGGEVGRGEKSGDAEQDRFEVVGRGAERPERQSLGEQGERELVLFVPERGGELLEKRGVVSVIFDDAFHPRSLALEAKLGG